MAGSLWVDFGEQRREHGGTTSELRRCTERDAVGMGWGSSRVLTPPPSPTRIVAPLPATKGHWMRIEKATERATQSHTRYSPVVWPCERQGPCAKKLLLVCLLSVLAVTHFRQQRHHHGERTAGRCRR